MTDYVSPITSELALKAFNALDLDVELHRILVVDFSSRMKAYGSRVTYNSKRIEFQLSSSWIKVDPEVIHGLFQSFFVRIFKVKKKTYHMDLYDHFIKHVNKTISPTKQDISLKSRFDDLNYRYFLSLLGETNLVWSKGKRTLGKFDYHTNTISISVHLKKYPDLLDYVLYHEMCHKKALFTKTRHKTMHHTGFFRDLENIYPNAEELEEKLKHVRL